MSQEAMRDEPPNGELTDSPEALWKDILKDMPSSLREFYYGPHSRPVASRDCTESLVDFLFDRSRPGELRNEVEKSSADDEGSSTLINADTAAKILDMERRIQRAYRAYGTFFPSSIWHCCSRCCFSMLAADGDQFGIFDEVLRIHEVTEALHKHVDDCKELAPTRSCAVGGGSIVHAAPSRSEREISSRTSETDRKRALRDLADFVVDVLPYLYGLRELPSGTPALKRKLCTEAICCLLGVSKNFLYGRKRAPQQRNASEEELTSIVDSSGVRLRQLRSREDRSGFPEISKLHQFECGCDEPCSSEVPAWRFHCVYREFASLSKQLKPRRKENQYLLNALFCPLLNSPVKVCNNALSALHTVSVPLIADVRRALEAMCDDPSLDDHTILRDGISAYTKTLLHPANRYGDYIRERVEPHLDMILRADPGASDGVYTYRVYAPEINIQEKLRTVIAKYLEGDETVDVRLSSTPGRKKMVEHLHVV